MQILYAPNRKKKKGNKKMTVDTVTLQYPTSDVTESVQVLADPTVHTIVSGAPINIENAFNCKDNTLTIVFTNSGETDGTAIIKKGVYQNAVLGDLNVTLAGGKTTVVKIENPSRFEKADGSLDVEFSTGFGGTVYAFGKKAGLG